jgi:hypothetical protein
MRLLLRSLTPTRGNHRVAQIRLLGQVHGTAELTQIYAQVAREVYVPDLAPDFAYVYKSEFYEREYFVDAYDLAADATPLKCPQLKRNLDHVHTFGWREMDTKVSGYKHFISDLSRQIAHYYPGQLSQ